MEIHYEYNKQELDELSEILCPNHYLKLECQACEYCAMDNECYCERNVFYNAQEIQRAGYRKTENVKKETAKEIFQELYDKLTETPFSDINEKDILEMAEKYGVEIKK